MWIFTLRPGSPYLLAEKEPNKRSPSTALPLTLQDTAMGPDVCSHSDVLLRLLTFCLSGCLLTIPQASLHQRRQEDPFHVISLICDQEESHWVFCFVTQFPVLSDNDDNLCVIGIYRLCLLILYHCPASNHPDSSWLVSSAVTLTDLHTWECPPGILSYIRRICHFSFEDQHY